MTEWTHDTSHTVQELYTNGITIVPDSGYYVYQVLIGCNDGSGYNCKTAKDNNVGRIVATSTQSSTVTISANWLTVDATIGGKLVWHPGHGAPSYVMVMLKESPNPATVTYDAGAMAGYISGYLVAYDKDASGEEPKGATVTPSYDDDKDTAEIKYQKDGGLDEGTTHLILKPNTKQVTKDGKTYQFTGWSIQYIDANGNPQNFKDSSATTLVLYRDYVLTAQWKEVETPTTATITINKVFTDGTNTLPTPENFVLKIDGETVNGTNLTYTKELTAGTYTVTEENYNISGYNRTSVKLEKLTGEDTWTEVQNIDVTAGVTVTYKLTNTYTRTQATSAVKTVVCDGDQLPDGFPTVNCTKPKRNATTNVIEPILVEGSSVTLLYKITVNGTAGAAFAVTESGDTTKVYPANAPAYDATTKTYTGEVGTDGTFVFYVTRTFDVSGANGTLRNTITMGEQEKHEDVPYYTPIELPLSVKKSMTGDALPDGFSKTFTVEVKSGEDLKTELSATVTNANASTGVDFAGNAIKITTAGNYTYTITEKSTNDSTITNDARLPITLTYEIDIHEANGVNELYVKSVTATDTENNTVTLGENDVLTLTNTYTAPATSAAVKITKTFEGLPEGATYPNVAIYLRNTSTDQLYRLAKADDSFIYTGSVPAGTYAIAENNNNYPGYAQTAIRLKDGNGTIEIKESDYGTTVEFELVNVYEKIEKTPAKVNFSDLIQKELTIKGDYKFEGETFYARLRMTAYRDNSIAKLSSALVPVDGASEAYTLTATFGENARWSGSTEDFEGETLYFPKAGTYRFRLHEKNEDKSGVTYDESVYVIYVVVKEATGNKLVIDTISCLKYANEDKLKNNEPESSTYTVLYKEGELTGKTITFYNTVNTGYKSNDHIKIDSPNKLNTDDHYAYIIGYPDGTVQPNGEITRAEVATIFFRLLKDDVREKYFTKTNDFSDVSRDDWFNNPVSTMAELGIVKGYPDGTFRPNEPITRAEFAAIAARFDESTRYGETRFTDVAGHWAIREIAKAYNNGWIKGYPDNTFRPNRNITRAEAMTLINRVLNRAPETEKDLLSNMNKWSDNMDVDAWYYLAVQEATNSHDYRRKSSSYEHWIRMLEDPNWAKYER